MTTEETMLDTDFSWDEPLITDAGSLEGKRQFAKVRMLPVPVVPFQKGASFTLENVHDDQYNADTQQTVRNGHKQFNGMKLGKTDKKHTIYVLVAEKTDRQGNAYQRVKWFKSWPEKDRKNVWAELQFPALKGFDNATRAKFLGQGIYAGYDEVSTGEQVNIQGKDYDTKYWTNFTIFADEASMKKAETDFFAQFADGANGASPGLDLTNIPANWLNADSTKWESGIQAMFKETQRWTKELGMKDGAVKVKILDKDGQPNPDKDGQPVNAVALLAKILDTPEPMIDLS